MHQPAVARAQRKKNSCRNCRKWAKRVGELEARITELEEELAKANKNSENSSKPPSSDIVKPSSSKGTKIKRKRGGQPGHPRHEREAFPTELIDEFLEYPLDHCPDCAGKMQPADLEPKIVQQIEIKTRPTIISQHRASAYWCATCEKFYYDAPLPSIVEKGGLAGPRLTAFVAYLKGAGHASFSTIRKFLRDVVGIKVSRGYLAKLINKLSRALKDPYEELFGSLADQPVLNIDETGHKDSGKQFWTWCSRAELFVLFNIDPSRSADVLIDVLGEEFDGVIGCDYFGAYRRYMRECNIMVRICLAHLIRDVKFLMKLPDSKERAYGKRLREGLRDLFAIIHEREGSNDEEFENILSFQRDELIRLATPRVPPGNHAQAIAKRFRQHGDSYFRFITTPGIEPTNNLAERAIRFVVIDRKVTQGSCGQNGQNWCARIWTAMATLTAQDRSAFEYLYEAVLAHWKGMPVPSLLPATVQGPVQLE